jgi:hypothetical protein
MRPSRPCLPADAAFAAAFSSALLPPLVLRIDEPGLLLLARLLCCPSPAEMLEGSFGVVLGSLYPLAALPAFAASVQAAMQSKVVQACLPQAKQVGALGNHGPRGSPAGLGGVIIDWMGRSRGGATRPPASRPEHPRGPCRQETRGVPSGRCLVTPRTTSRSLFLGGAAGRQPAASGHPNALLRRP